MNSTLQPLPLTTYIARRGTSLARRRADGPWCLTFGVHMQKDLADVPTTYLRQLLDKPDYGPYLDDLLRAELARRRDSGLFAVPQERWVRYRERVPTHVWDHQGDTLGLALDAQGLIHVMVDQGEGQVELWCEPMPTKLLGGLA